MNFEDIERLALEAKKGDEWSKEALCIVFKPLIYKLSGKYHIHSYEFSDIQNECLAVIIKCINTYNPERHQFAAYATAAIKNTLNYLLRDSLKNSKIDGLYTLICDNDSCERNLSSIQSNLEEEVISKCSIGELSNAVKRLKESEKHLIVYVYFKGCTLKSYAEQQGIHYSSVIRQKNAVMKKLQRYLSHSEENSVRSS